MKALLVLACLAVASNGLLFSPHRDPVSGQPKLPATCPGYPDPSASPADVADKLAEAFEAAEKEVAAILAKYNATGGVAMSVVYRDTVLWTKGFGFINMSDPDRGPPTGNTGFRIGSITKVFTALMMLMWRDRGLLPSLDANITTYLPEFKIVNPYQTQRGITFRQLASHMAGLPRESPCPNVYFDGCNATSKEIFERLAKLVLLSPPDTQPSYSNLGFALLGRTLERVFGGSWEVALEMFILSVLGMKNTGTAFTPEVLENLAVGYSSNGAVAKLINIGFENPAGQMFSSTNDLAELMKMIFRDQEAVDPERQQLIDGETIREWMHPAYKYHDGTGFGYPWELIPIGNYTARTKDGGINGYTSLFAMAPEIKTGFICLQSCDNCGSIAEVFEVGTQLLTEISTMLWTMQPATRIPPNPAQYVGTYTAALTPEAPPMSITITLGEVWGSLALMAEGLVLQWEGDDRFKLTTAGRALPCALLSGGLVGASAYILRDEARAVRGFTVPGLVYGAVFEKKS